MGATGYGNFTRARISAPTTGWILIFSNSSLVSLPGFEMMCSGTASLPKLWMHAAGVRPFRRGYTAISSAPKARCVGGVGSGLSRRGGTLEFVAEVLKVFLADL